MNAATSWRGTSRHVELAFSMVLALAGCASAGPDEEIEMGQIIDVSPLDGSEPAAHAPARAGSRDDSGLLVTELSCDVPGLAAANQPGQACWSEFGDKQPAGYVQLRYVGPDPAFDYILCKKREHGLRWRVEEVASAPFCLDTREDR